MPGFLLDTTSQLSCPHQGAAKSPAPAIRVTIMGQPVLTQPTPDAIGGCANPPEAGGPCVAAQWVSAATRITTLGQPVLLGDSQAVCTPTGTPLTAIPVQIRVKGI